MQILHNSPTTSVNYVKFAPFMYVSDPCHSKELCEIPANQAEFTQFAHRTTQNLHKLLTHLYYVSEACPSRERSEIPANYANSA